MTRTARWFCVALLVTPLVWAGFASSSVSAPAGAADKTLDIYLIDVEGGAATLVVTPRGESLLVDAGNAGDRDPARIVRVASEIAGLKKIDHHIITHWHGDHFGGTEAVAAKLPIGHFYDHGPSVEPGNFDEKFAWYLKLSDGKRTVLKPGDEIKLAASSDRGAPILKLACVCAAGKVFANKDGSQPPDGCDKHPAQDADKSDNAASVGFKLSFGDFDFVDCGDLTWNIEHRLVCPENKLGVVDVFQTNHHGLSNSNNPALVHALAPRVAVMNNGPRKGGEPAVFKTLRSSPGLESVFAVHRNVRVDASDNAAVDCIANADENCSGDYVWLKVAPDSKSYTVAAGAKGKPQKFQSK